VLATKDEALRSPVVATYLAFGKSSRRRSRPSGVLAAGSDIIDNTSGLEQHFIPLLTRS
jgi:hypothetical protein